MKTIIFGFSSPKKWKPFAWIIMKRDDSPFSHGYTRFPSNSWGESFVYENSGHATHFKSYSHFLEDNRSIEEYSLEVENDLEARVGHLCITREGKKYGVSQIIGKGLVWLIEVILNKSIKNPISSGDDETDCIEEQAAILKNGLEIQVPLDMDSISVKPFRDWIATIPGIVRTL